MKIIKKKIAPKWYWLHIQDLKPWELRINDCDYQKGDCLILQEWDRGKYTGRELITMIEHVATDLPYLSNDIVILTIREAKAIEKEQIKKTTEEETK